MNLRIGHGFDVHAFEKGRPLVLGGVTIPSEFGLLGHSDADVLLHAVTDAVLGALAWGDIGGWFPDTDEMFRGIDSKVLFAEVWRKAHRDGWALNNVDVVVLAEKPKLAPHILPMRKSIAGLFQATIEQVGVKATTTERLGFVGREEGMAASATVLLVKK